MTTFCHHDHFCVVFKQNQLQMNRKILFLPDAGYVNPFQQQLMRFLQGNGLKVCSAPSRRFFATWRAVRQHRPDIIYFDWIQSFIIGRNLPVTLLKCLTFTLEILYLTKIRRIPVLHTLHNLRNHAKRQVGIERWMYRFFLRHCTRIRVYSPTTITKARRLFGIPTDHFRVIQDVPFHYFYPNNSGFAKSRQHLGMDEYAFVYLFLGMVKPYKGLEDLIAAFGQLNDPKARLVIAGISESAEYARQIQRLADGDPRITYHNRFVAIEDVQHYLNAAQVVVLPFRNVEHSGSMDLALSFGKPIISLETRFFAELLSHQQPLLFNHSDGALLDALQNAQRMDLDAIARRNFQIADSVNHRDLLPFFTDGF